jgi:hypothetical protein
MAAQSSPDPGTAREEAERLVATAIGAASMAARRLGRTRGPVSSSQLGEALPAGLGTLADALVDRARSAFGIGHTPADYRIANGSPECCVCPVCRTIAAVRDPSPQAAERLATGAGDLAAGVASFLRAVAGAAGSGADRERTGAEREPAGPEPGRTGAERGRAGAAGAGQPGPAWPAPEEPVSSGAVGDVWQAATRGPAAESGPGAEPGPAAEPGPGAAPTARKPMAKKAVKPAARRAPGEAAAGQPAVTPEEGDRPRGAGPAGRRDEGR